MKFAFDCPNIYSNISIMCLTLLTKGTAVLTVKTMLKKGHRNDIDSGWFVCNGCCSLAANGEES